MKDYQERVVVEMKELANRLLKLTEFKETRVFRSLDKEDQGLLFEQFDHMKAYLEVLVKRISRF